MDYKIKIGEEIHSIQAELPDESGSYRVVIQECQTNVRAKSVSPGFIQAQIDDRSYNLFLAPEADGTWIWVDGRARFVQDADKIQRRKASGPTAGPTQVTPPTPASVVKIFVEIGQEVEKGQAVVVVSAMKMEITLVAPYAGTVTAVNTEMGAQARPGDILVDIEPHHEEEETKDE